VSAAFLETVEELAEKANLRPIPMPGHKYADLEKTYMMFASKDGQDFSDSKTVSESAGTKEAISG